MNRDKNLDPPELSASFDLSFLTQKTRHKLFDINQQNKMACLWLFTVQQNLSVK